MNKFFTLTFLLPFASFAMNLDESIIPNASYVIYEGATGITGGVPTGSKLATFYTFDGQPIQTVEHHMSFPVIERKLDKSAPKPAPTQYEVKYWPAIKLAFGMTKGVPGNFILFYDKNGNIIDRFRFNEGDHVQQFSDKLNLTRVKQK